MLVTRLFRTLAIAVSFALAAPGAALARTQPQGTVDDARLRELSGLVVSPSDPARYWAHNDSGNPADLFALDRAGRVLARVGIRDAVAFDWEDIAAFTLRGQPYLAIADSGDNLRWRGTLEIVVVHEPAPRRGSDGLVLSPAWTLRVRLPDGARDIEALGADAARAQFWMVEKTDGDPTLYRLPLHAQDMVIAQASGTLRLGAACHVAAKPCVRAGRVTALDFDRAARQALLLTTQGAYWYRRAPAQDWQQAFAGVPVFIPLPRLRQPEALAFDADGQGFTVSSEGRKAPLLHVDLPARR
ncbi:hypothetical protein [Metallibacterium scheffleri]|uniref:hypothetical protein n=1 Tax=Metallibacterium scheffleri TaxID=993689 RepID=UPI0023F4FD1F|nr:hypothetical protein [Metallibacterium scheffleri]